MIIEITQEEKNELIRNTMDRVSYCEGYKEELKALNNKYNPHKTVKYRYEAINPKFPLHEAI